MVNEVIEQRRFEDGGGVKLLAGDGRADDGKNAGANDRADPEGSERPRAEGLFEAMLGKLRVSDELVDRFGGEELIRQVDRSGEKSVVASSPAVLPLVLVEEAVLESTPASPMRQGRDVDELLNA